jgi:hypothetical protein
MPEAAPNETLKHAHYAEDGEERGSDKRPANGGGKKNITTCPVAKPTKGAVMPARCVCG